MECIVIVGIMKNATTKGLIAFDFGSFVKSKDLTPYSPIFPRFCICFDKAKQGKNLQRGADLKKKNNKR
jgi:hypothetical protein